MLFGQQSSREDPDWQIDRPMLGKEISRDFNLLEIKQYPQGQTQSGYLYVNSFAFSSSFYCVFVFCFLFFHEK